MFWILNAGLVPWAKRKMVLLKLFRLWNIIIIAHFREHLEANGGAMSSILHEVKDTVQYA